MTMAEFGPALERKFARLGDGADGGLVVTDGVRIAGYASVFGRPDQGGDVVAAGAYAKSLAKRGAGGVKLLWQHDPREPIGVWDEVREDATGLYVKGRLLDGIARGREAAALIAAGAIDGLSIGYRTVRAAKDDAGRRVLSELELWEVSLVTFPMLPEARLGATKGDAPDLFRLRRWAGMLSAARGLLAAERDGPDDRAD
jgi:HK97 family phage prohead protease